MAIHVEHVGVLERAREVSRLEDIITEDNEDIEAEMPKMGDDPAGKEARFLKAVAYTHLTLPTIRPVSHLSRL
ncbi:hypothetical protein N3K61_24825, partial [Escherichia coli]|nr:hypothetical protein [Escherichia coli]